MTRILYWNIDNFSAVTIDDASTQVDPVYGIAQNVAAGDRSDYILSHLSVTLPGGGAALPDIIVIVEVFVGLAGYTGRGNVVAGAAGIGVRLLLDNIRLTTGNAGWMLIPPLQTGQYEGVAVYYDSTRYCFSGPSVWPGGNGPSIAAGGAVANYPQVWAGTLPVRVIPAGLPNAGANETQVAAQVAFNNVPAVNGGAAIVYPGNLRAPFWVTLAEVNYGPVPPVVGRSISLFVVHGPAGNALATTYTNNLVDIDQIVNPANAPTEVRLVLGDFNINVFEANYLQRVCYTPMLNAQFEMGIAQPGIPWVVPPTPAPPNPFTGYRGFFSTHLPTNVQATFWYIGNNSDFYPGYGCVQSPTYSLDNVLVRFGQAAGVPCGALQNVTVLNGIVGSPYVPPAPNGAPLGHYLFGIKMGTVADYTNPPAQFLHPHGAAEPQKVSLRQWINLGHIRSTSDHMPVLFDV